MINSSFLFVVSVFPLSVFNLTILDLLIAQKPLFLILSLLLFVLLYVFGRRPRIASKSSSGSIPVIELKKGANLNLKGKANSSKMIPNSAKTYALQPKDFIGMSPIPKIVPAIGDNVLAGQPLFFDKKRPKVIYTSPVAGELVAINRGEKRSINEIVIKAANEQNHLTLPELNLEKSSREEIKEFLLDNGGWAFLRQRPYNINPDPDVIPRDIFISTFSTAPLAPDMEILYKSNAEYIQVAVDMLNKLTDGKVYMGSKASDKVSGYTGLKGVEHFMFKGPHPAGNVGVQMHHIKPLNAGETVWTLGVQELLVLGRMIKDRHYHTERLVAITGEDVQNPGYVRTYIGACISELVEGNINNSDARFVAGDVLTGKKKNREGFLGFFDNQLSIVQEGNYLETLGWLIPGRRRPSLSGTMPNLFGKKEYSIDTNTHGEGRAFVVTGEYEKYLPMDIYPQHLMKAIVTNDYENMEGLGILELVEEDVALGEFACTSKAPLQKILRDGLDMIREQN